MLCVPVTVYGVDFQEGFYTEKLSALVEDSSISGHVTINFSSQCADNAAVIASDKRKMSGMFEGLNINLFNSNLIGIESKQGGEVELDGPVFINNIVYGLTQQYWNQNRDGWEYRFYTFSKYELRRKGLQRSCCNTGRGYI